MPKDASASIRRCPRSGTLLRGHFLFVMETPENKGLGSDPGLGYLEGP